MISYKGYDEVIRNVLDHGQGHVFAYWDELGDDEKVNLLEDLKSVDLTLMKSLFDGIRSEEPGDFGPAPFIAVPSTGEEKARYDEARSAGVGHIREGKVAAFVVAGGQGSRLGFEGPKGKFPVGPVSDRTLFQIHGEKIAKYSEKYNTVIPWLVMTSKGNHEETAVYFRENSYFGINEKDVFIFPQNMIPSLDTGGNLVMESKSSLFKNPDGHGGSLTALNSSGVLDEMIKRGIETISYFQVDNPLVKIVDPAFIGFHVLRGAEISSKALKKAYPEEKVGVFVTFTGGRIGVVEYSDLSSDKAHEKDGAGNLVYTAGSIAIHLFDARFVKRITGGADISLPFHTAKKKLAVIEKGKQTSVDGYKFEKFVFDALPLTDKNVVFETIREEEFAPVKNATGVDSLETSQSLMMELHRRWLRERGISVPDAVQKLEISPLLAVEPGDLDSSLVVPGEEKVYLK
ncbi:MAG: hypothetical protein CVV44_17340 [Spirochaetae bacterium HGW-Spirochaetae-1]|jgi:UDP-N-acetylglucosamine/UDP-N-acetylgalactosamine diphosphorylase|nr:MAG: hypothetical protein CVV44_17340 [Spirochaetae bacterium HGW-Spirochaetae-1]